MEINYIDEGHRNLNHDIPICKILGVNIAAINMKWLVEYTKNNIEAMSGRYMCVTNVHTTVLAYEDDKYKLVQNSSVLSMPDGGPLSTLGRRNGFRNMERTTGPSYMGEIFKISPRYGWKHYFYGSTPETLQRLRVKLDNDFPEIKIVGMYSPPFRPLTESEDIDIINRINESKPDFVWVGLGAPKQEIWMFDHNNKIKGLMVGVGAGFDYYAGNIKRAPKWMQNNNLEWLYRLKQDPKRLFFRYLCTNCKFLWHTVIRGRK